MNGLKLYEISNEYQSLLNSEEYFVDIEDKLNQIEDQLNLKAINVAAYIKNMEAEESAIKNAITEMKEREKKVSSKIDSLKSYLLFNLGKCNIQEIKSIQFDIKVKKCPPSVTILNDDYISEEYKSVKEVISIDKNKIKSDIFNGVIVEGAEITYNNRLEIK